MKLGHWLLRQRPGGQHTSSQLVPALDRVREMRQQSGWEPLTSVDNIRERGDRLSTARRDITIPRLASEREAHRESRAVWLSQMFGHDVFGRAVIILLGLSVVILVWVLFGD